MPNHDVRRLCETTRVKLKLAIDKLEQFLNHCSLEKLQADEDPAMEEFYQLFLQDIRHLSVFSEVAYEKLGVSLRRPQLNKEYSEKVLYDVYHNCVDNFFHPKNECYSEDGRYAYTGQDAIRFRKKPHRIARDLIVSLSSIFEELREELIYYQTDYIAHNRIKGEKL